MSGVGAYFRRNRRLFARMSLGSQLAVFLTVAIAPIGAIAIVQAMYTARETSELAVKALVDQARLAADEERKAITSAFGVATGLSLVLPLDPAEASRCSSRLAQLVTRDPRFVFAGVLTPDGLMRCASAPLEKPVDFSTDLEIQRLFEDDRRQILVIRDSIIAETPVLLVNHPEFRDGELVAYISIALPISLLSTIAKASNEDADFHLGLLDADGDVFVEDAVEADEIGWTPETLEAPSDIEHALTTRTFEARSMSGERRTYVVTPIFDADIYALGAWRSAGVGERILVGALLAALFPAIMLALALGVAYFAVHWLALRHVFYLARIMRAFEGGRRSVRASALREAPTEIAALGRAFDHMADTIERDEAELAHVVEEKTTLLREVYHRVKNNLQLIISIMNMQIRAAQTPGEREIIARLQDRVMGLASIHQRLYEANDLTAVRCDALIEEVAKNLVHSTAGAEGGHRLTVEADEILLNPDRAIPLALFATETIMNALKHGAAASNGGWLKVALRREAGSCVTLTVSNLKPDQPRRRDAMNTAIGGQLIRAFSNQLSGEMSTEEDGPEYRVTLKFDGVRQSTTAE